jgi:hypothetical protein
MTNLFLEVQRDDGVAVYLNGFPLYRNNLPSGVLTHLQLATNADDQGNSWLSQTLPLTQLLPGTNVIAVEVHQSSRQSSDLGFNLRLKLLGSVLGPAIHSQPQSLTRSNGQSASFSVNAMGSGSLSYQWQHNGTNLPGATLNAVNIPNVSQLNAGEYQVIVTNTVGAVTSLVARLTLLATDTDGDGISDDVEIAGGTDPFVDDRNADPDNDGSSNVHEYLAGTSPTNAASVFRIETTLISGGRFVLNFGALSNRSYSVEEQFAVGGHTWQRWQDILAASSNRTIWLTNSAGGSNVFFRLKTPMNP